MTFLITWHKKSIIVYLINIFGEIYHELQKIYSHTFRLIVVNIFI